ncbi:MAG TPA: prepilin-type N-terminal cleavage/methylation domain-containing protein [Chloroflexota bacterium]
MAGKSRGFTLIELLVVVAIIGVLSAIIISDITAARAKSRDAARQTAIHNIQNALELYFSVNGQYPLSGGALTPNGGWTTSTDASWTTLQTALRPYISSLPQDPSQSASGWPGSGAYAFSYYSQGYGCPQRWYMLIWRSEATTLRSPGVTACSGQYFNYAGTVTVGNGR